MAHHRRASVAAGRAGCQAFAVLASFQEALVALATDCGMRTRFGVDPVAALASFDLDAVELARLAAVPHGRLEAYAQGLLDKRWRQVLRVVPRTARVARDLAGRYRRFVMDNPPSVEDSVLPPGPAEAVRALPVLRKLLLEDAGSPSYCADLLTFEVLGSCSAFDGLTRRMAAHYALHDLAPSIDRGVLPVDPDPVDIDYVFGKDGVRWMRAADR